MANVIDGKTILITGGTGSFGKCFSKYVMTHYNPKKIIIYSRDEFKQFVMSNDPFFKEHADRMREYNPAEAIKTNIGGAMNVIDAALDSDVTKVVALSTDKAVNPVNLYGGTKFVSDKLFIAANAYAGTKDISFSIVRYGNVAGSRGSVIPFFHNLIEKGETCLPITDYRMTRFWISLEQGVELVIKALEEAHGGETFISKIPSFYVKDLAEAMLPGCTTREVGIRPGEKLHEVMVTVEDAPNTLEYEKNFIVYPQITYNNRQVRDLSGKPVADGFTYSSGTNTEWLSVEDIRKKLENFDYEED